MAHQSSGPDPSSGSVVATLPSEGDESPQSGAVQSEAPAGASSRPEHDAAFPISPSDKDSVSRDETRARVEDRDDFPFEHIGPIHDAYRAWTAELEPAVHEVLFRAETFLTWLEHRAGQGRSWPDKLVQPAAKSVQAVWEILPGLASQFAYGHAKDFMLLERYEIHRLIQMASAGVDEVAGSLIEFIDTATPGEQGVDLAALERLSTILQEFTASLDELEIVWNNYFTKVFIYLPEELEMEGNQREQSNLARPDWPDLGFRLRVASLEGIESVEREVIQSSAQLTPEEAGRLITLGVVAVKAEAVKKAERELAESVGHARDVGSSWSDVSRVIGVTQSAARRKFDPASRDQHRDYNRVRNDDRRED